MADNLPNAFNIEALDADLTQFSKKYKQLWGQINLDNKNLQVENAELLKQIDVLRYEKTKLNAQNQILVQKNADLTGKLTSSNAEMNAFQEKNTDLLKENGILLNDKTALATVHEELVKKTAVLRGNIESSNLEKESLRKGILYLQNEKTAMLNKQSTFQKKLKKAAKQSAKVNEQFQLLAFGPLSEANLNVTATSVTLSQQAGEANTSQAYNAPSTELPINGRENSMNSHDNQTLCDICNKLAITPARGENLIDWIHCEKCQKWFHNVCIGLVTAPDSDYTCKDCILDLNDQDYQAKNLYQASSSGKSTKRKK